MCYTFVYLITYFTMWKYKIISNKSRVNGKANMADDGQINYLCNLHKDLNSSVQAFDFTKLLYFDFKFLS